MRERLEGVDVVDGREGEARLVLLHKGPGGLLGEGLFVGCQVQSHLHVSI